MVEQNIIQPKVVRKQNTLYFAHYKKLNEIKKLYQKDPYWEEFFKNIQYLSSNNWKLHRTLTHLGINPSEILNIIRNDDENKLKQITMNSNFDFNQKIVPSLYERFQVVNNKYVSLIDYAAFYGSIKCFKYLLSQGANVRNTANYAVANGNIEIIRLCKQNHSNFSNSYNVAIQFHQNAIFNYLYEMKICNTINLEELGKECILSNNYQILLFLEKEGMKITDIHINYAALTGNIFLILYFLRIKKILPKDIFFSVVVSGNIELAQFILNQIELNVNEKNICFIYFLYVLFI